MPIISIIVPVYNVEKYLDKCVKSILAQTFKDFELILVDDGSKDLGGEMCDEYLKIDPRVKVIHKENGGLSSARNAGIEIAAGEFIGFVDSDDYIEADMYELLYNNIIKENADMSVCGIYDCYVGKALKKSKECYKVLNTEEAIFTVLEGKLFSVPACNKLYKNKLFNETRYPEKKAAEDAFVIIDLLMKCEVIVFSSEQKYYYYHRENSITTQRSAANCFDTIEAYKKNYDLINFHYPSLHNSAMSRLCWSYFFALDRLLNSNDEDKYIDREKNIIKFLRKNAGFIIFKSSLSMTRKMAMVALLFSRSAYKKLLGANTKFNLRINS